MTFMYISKIVVLFGESPVSIKKVNVDVCALHLNVPSPTVQDLEEKVQRSKRDRRNSLHRTQLLESQMKTVRGELVDTLDHLQELRNVLRRSQQQAEERKAAMEKLSTGLR